MKHSGFTTNDMVDYVRPVTRKKADVIIMHLGTNDLTNRVNTMSKVRKIVCAIQEVENTRNIQFFFLALSKVQTKIIVNKLRITILD